MLPPGVIWVDPGYMTGIAFLYLAHTPEPYFLANEYEFQEACRIIEQAADSYKGKLAIGWERFDINAETHKKTRAGIYDALHVIGVCRYIAYKYGCRAMTPAQQHTPTATDRERLQKLGWWEPGKDDAQSAAAHMLRYLEQENELTPAQRERLYSS
jgi:hypothetical protein